MVAAMTDLDLLSEFKAPSWAGHWCPRCDWDATCPDCRRHWT